MAESGPGTGAARRCVGAALLAVTLCGTGVVSAQSTTRTLAIMAVEQEDPAGRHAGVADELSLYLESQRTRDLWLARRLVAAEAQKLQIDPDNPGSPDWVALTTTHPADVYLAVRYHVDRVGFRFRVTGYGSNAEVLFRFTEQGRGRFAPIKVFPKIADRLAVEIPLAVPRVSLRSSAVDLISCSAPDPR